MMGDHIKLTKARRPNKADKADDPKYCSYHRMIGHPTRSYYICKDQIQILVDAYILKLWPKQKQVSTNMISCIHIGPALPMVT